MNVEKFLTEYPVDNEDSFLERVKDLIHDYNYYEKNAREALKQYTETRDKQDFEDYTDNKTEANYYKAQIPTTPYEFDEAETLNTSMVEPETKWSDTIYSGVTGKNGVLKAYEKNRKEAVQNVDRTALVDAANDLLGYSANLRFFSADPQRAQQALIDNYVQALKNYNSDIQEYLQATPNMINILAQQKYLSTHPEYNINQGAEDLKRMKAKGIVPKLIKKGW